MSRNILILFFSVGSVALLVLCVFFYVRSDRVAPEFRFSAMDLVYGPRTEEADLLGGVLAFDGVDGDVSDRIAVEKVVVNNNRGTAVVYYAVSDLSGNVAKQSRVFPADIDALSGERAGTAEEYTGEPKAAEQETVDPPGIHAVYEEGPVYSYDPETGAFEERPVLTGEQANGNP